MRAINAAIRNPVPPIFMCNRDGAPRRKYCAGNSPLSRNGAQVVVKRRVIQSPLTLSKHTHIESRHTDDISRLSPHWACNLKCEVHALWLAARDPRSPGVKSARPRGCDPMRSPSDHRPTDDQNLRATSSLNVVTSYHISERSGC